MHHCASTGAANAVIYSSNGHGCMLHYALLHLFGYKLTMEDLKKFRVGALFLIPPW
jgi:transketolase